MISRARYASHGDPRQVEVALDASEEFVYTGPSETHRGALHYNWLQCGRSLVERIPENRGAERAFARSAPLFSDF